MKNFLKQINWFQMNLAAWIVIIVTYIAPIQFEYDIGSVGFPLPFLDVYDKGWNYNLLMSFYLNIGALLIDIIIVYFIIVLIDKLIKIRKRNH